MSANRSITVYGAYGHTGRFIVAELARLGFEPILAGRDLAKLAPVAERNGGVVRQVEVTDTAGLDAQLSNADAVINAAGPFGDTSPPLIEAALRAGIPYFDVTGEPFVAQELFKTYAAAARDRDVVVAPAFGFFGALGDLLVSAAIGDSVCADSIELAFALDQWRATKGSRLAGARRAGRRLIRSAGRFEVHDPDRPQPSGRWHFQPPFGDQPMVGEFSTVDVVTIARHINVDSISTWINEAPLADLSDADTSGPEAVDESGRSAQQFALEVVVRCGSEERRARASGRDIYAITAPIVCEGLSWVLNDRAHATGVVTAGELFDARPFLAALSPELSTDLPARGMA